MARYVRTIPGSDKDRPVHKLHRVVSKMDYATPVLLAPIRKALKSPDWHGEYFDRREPVQHDGRLVMRTIFYFTKDYTAFQFKMRFG